MPRTMLSQRKTLPTNSACCQLQALEVAAAACSRRDMTPRPTSGSTAGQQSNQLQCSISIQWGFALIDCPTGACAAVSSRQAQRGSQQPRPLCLGHLLEPLRHHRLLVLLELLRVAHVLRRDPPQVGPDPAEAQRAEDDQLDVVAGHALLDPCGLEAVVHGVSQGEDARADEEDVLAGVAKGGLDEGTLTFSSSSSPPALLSSPAARAIREEGDRRGRQRRGEEASLQVRGSDGASPIARALAAEHPLPRGGAAPPLAEEEATGRTLGASPETTTPTRAFLARERCIMACGLRLD